MNINQMKTRIKKTTHIKIFVIFSLTAYSCFKSPIESNVNASFLSQFNDAVVLFQKLVCNWANLQLQFQQLMSKFFNMEQLPTVRTIVIQLVTVVCSILTLESNSASYQISKLFYMKTQENVVREQENSYVIARVQLKALLLDSRVN